MKFNGLIYTDSMAMYAISKNFGNGQAAVMAVKAGVDFVLDMPEPDAAFAAIKAAVQSGEIPRGAGERVGRADPAGEGAPGPAPDADGGRRGDRAKFGGRANARAAQEICERGLTLLKDERNQVPLKVAKDADVLYLSVLDYASGWREGAPSRTFIPELKKRWPNVTAIEMSDRTTAVGDGPGARAGEAVRRGRRVGVRAHLVLQRPDGPVAGAGRRCSSRSRPTRRSRSSTVLFGNPYTAMALPKLPALLVTYEQFDAMEAAAVRAMAGEIPIGGKLPITLPGLFPLGTGWRGSRAGLRAPRPCSGHLQSLHRHARPREEPLRPRGEARADADVPLDARPDLHRDPPSTEWAAATPARLAAGNDANHSV